MMDKVYNVVSRAFGKRRSPSKSFDDYLREDMDRSIRDFFESLKNDIDLEVLSEFSIGKIQISVPWHVYIAFKNELASQAVFTAP